MLKKGDADILVCTMPAQNLLSAFHVKGIMLSSGTMRMDPALFPGALGRAQ